MDINVNSDIEKEYRGVKQNSYNSSAFPSFSYYDGNQGWSW